MGSAVSRTTCRVSSYCNRGLAVLGAAQIFGRSGFLPTAYQGVPFRSGGDPILDLSNPDGVSARTQRNTLDALRDLNLGRQKDVGDPEISTRIAAYEMAYRMQTSGPDLIDFRQGEQRDARDVRRRARQELLREQLPAGAPPGGARNPFRAVVSHRVGSPRRSSESRSKPHAVRSTSRRRR